MSDEYWKFMCEELHCKDAPAHIRECLNRTQTKPPKNCPKRAAVLKYLEQEKRRQVERKKVSRYVYINKWFEVTEK